jgi:hypothetical protein
VKRWKKAVLALCGLGDAAERITQLTRSGSFLLEGVDWVDIRNDDDEIRRINGGAGGEIEAVQIRVRFRGMGTDLTKRLEIGDEYVVSISTAALETGIPEL